MLKRLINKSKRLNTHIVFHENDPRIKKACRIIQKQNIAEPVFITKSYYTKERLKKYSQVMYRLRKHKGWSLQKCSNLLKDPNYFGVMMIITGEADAMIAGALQPTAKTLRPALQLLRKGPVSGAMLMLHPKKPMLFADISVTPDPTSKELAVFATDTAKTMKKLGITPKVALLSFSTKGSAKHQLVDKVANAVKLLKKASFKVDGELQADAALVPEIAKLKASKSKIKGDANVLIFPDLQSGNIGYKLVHRLANTQAVGPIIQGLKKPVNDLSRGCSVDDIVKLAAITALQTK
ncbi:MAG: phosphotransacetylase [Candidatus Nanoarchaeia archaeon]